MKNDKKDLDEDFKAIIKREKKRVLWGILASSIGACITYCVYYYFDSTIENFSLANMTLGQDILFYTSLCTSFSGFGFYMVALDNTKKQVGTSIIKSALNEVFDSVSYYHDEHLPASLIEKADMDFPFDWDLVWGSDLVKGTYKGVHVMLSDVQLLKKNDTNSGLSDTITQFEGLWMVCDFKKRLSTELRLYERSRFRDSFNKGSVQTDSTSFNKQFIIETKVPQEAFYILTPHMMEYIQAMDKRANGNTYMCFLRQGKVHIAIHSGRNAFEVENLLRVNVDKLRKRFIGEVKYITDLIDELHLVDTFFEENKKKKKSPKKRSNLH